MLFWTTIWHPVGSRQAKSGTGTMIRKQKLIRSVSFFKIVALPIENNETLYFLRIINDNTQILSNFSVKKKAFFLKTGKHHVVFI